MAGQVTLMTKARLLCAVTLVAVGAVTGQSGCGSDTPAAGRTSRRGEVCQVANDCTEGLFCAPMPGSTGGVCVTGSFKITKTAKECAIVECAGASDCCDESLAAGCAQLAILCAADAGTGSTQACQQYADQCGCQSGRIDCEAGKCISRCNTDQECSSTSSGRRCAGGKCVQCAIDSDCTDGRQCVTGVCQAPCTNDGSCSGFDRCLSGRCIASGCQTDRECVAATRNVDARCGTDGKCIVPCETDLECGSPTSYSFFSCIEKQCTYVGCESDKDCRLFYTGPSDASTLPGKQYAVCRDVGLLGDVVKPAH
jgi:hypothetical protein